jgi:hypothetical protein
VTLTLPEQVGVILLLVALCWVACRKHNGGYGR